MKWSTSAMMMPTPIPYPRARASSASASEDVSVAIPGSSQRIQPPARWPTRIDFGRQACCSHRKAHRRRLDLDHRRQTRSTWASCGENCRASSSMMQRLPILAPREERIGQPAKNLGLEAPQIFALLANRESRRASGTTTTSSLISP